MRIQEINCEQSLQAIISLSIMKSKILPNCLKGKYEYRLENLEFNISNTLFMVSGAKRVKSDAQGPGLFYGSWAMILDISINLYFNRVTQTVNQYCLVLSRGALINNTSSSICMYLQKRYSVQYFYIESMKNGLRVRLLRLGLALHDCRFSN